MPKYNQAIQWKHMVFSIKRALIATGVQPLSQSAGEWQPFIHCSFCKSNQGKAPSTNAMPPEGNFRFWFWYLPSHRGLGEHVRVYSLLCLSVCNSPLSEHILCTRLLKCFIGRAVQTHRSKMFISVKTTSYNFMWEICHGLFPLPLTLPLSPLQIMIMVIKEKKKCLNEILTTNFIWISLITVTFNVIGQTLLSLFQTEKLPRNVKGILIISAVRTHVSTCIQFFLALTSSPVVLSSQRSLSTCSLDIREGFGHVK